MPEHGGGVPIWVDVSSTDLDKTRAFYAALFGWDPQVSPDPQYGGYTLFQLDGKVVAGAGGVFGDAVPAWATYLKADDAAETVRKAEAAGGQALMGPVEIPGQGTMAVLRDPTGALISLWQPLGHRGAEVFNDAGAFCWSELYTRDIPRASAFYSDVFGWTVEESESPTGPYALFKLDDRPMASGQDMSFMPAEVPSHWIVYFTVTDANAAIETAKANGGSLAHGPVATPMGPYAVIQDPVGAVFAIIQINQ